jgi:hypothetical protein
VAALDGAVDGELPAASSRGLADTPLTAAGVGAAARAGEPPSPSRVQATPAPTASAAAQPMAAPQRA